MATFDIIVPAGGTLEPQFADVVGTTNKTLIRFEGTTVLRRTLLALRESGVVGRIALVGSQAVLNHPDSNLADFKIAERQTGPQNIIAGLNAILETGDRERVGICTSDLPFLTPDAIRNFMNATGDKDFYAPVIWKDAWDEAYPMATASFVKLKDGHITLGCLYNTSTSGLKRALSYIEQAFEARKSKMQLAKLLGFPFVVKYVTRQLTIPEVVSRVEDILHLSVQPVFDAAPEFAFDIDYPDDYHYALQNYAASLRGKWTPTAAGP